MYKKHCSREENFQFHMLSTYFVTCAFHIEVGILFRQKTSNHLEEKRTDTLCVHSKYTTTKSYEHALADDLVGQDTTGTATGKRTITPIWKFLHFPWHVP